MMELTPENVMKVLAGERHGLSTTQLSRMFGNVHRMVLGGYLKAMVHLGLLTLVERPPSHIYRLGVEEMDDTVQVAKRLDELLATFKADLKRIAEEV